MLLDAATKVDTKQVGPSQQNVGETQESTEPSQLEVLTGHGTRTGKIKQYRDKVVKFLDNIVTVAKSSYTLKQQGRNTAENLAFAKEILFAAEDIEECLEYLCMFGSKIIDEYQKNTTERTPQEEQQQEQQPSGLASKKNIVRHKRHFHPETTADILQPYYGPEIVNRSTAQYYCKTK